MYRRRFGNRACPAAALGLLILMLLLFSAFFVSSEADHHCSEDHCPVCECLQQCKESLNRAGNGALLSISPVLPVFLSVISCSLYACLQETATPVTRKTRLNN